MKQMPSSRIHVPRAEGLTAAISEFVAAAVAIAPKNQSTFGVSNRGSRSSVSGGGIRSACMGGMMELRPDGTALQVRDPMLL
jgi:hypothetical protein